MAAARAQKFGRGHHHRPPPNAKMSQQQDQDSSIQLPLPCIRSLNDKMFDKKKAACREIELLTKELNANGRTNQIRSLVDYLVKNFINSAAPNSKIGGLVAVSSVAIALDSDAKHYLDPIVRPIFECTCDPQRDVRYRALESLYNVAKCVRGDILRYLDDIFDIIIRLGEDADWPVIKEASSLMDKLIKDIVIEMPMFDVTSLLGVIRERIYALPNNTRKLILSWISFLDSLPDVDLLIFIDDILDGLLKIACDSNLDIRRTAQNILEEFFKKLQSNPKRVDFKPLVKVLLIHVQADNLLVQNISLKWLDQFLKVGNENDILFNSSSILAWILPCLSASNRTENDQERDNYQRKNIELANSINENLMNLVTRSKMTTGTGGEHSETFSSADKAGTAAAANENDTMEEQFKIFKILRVLANELELGAKASAQTKIAVLEWIYQLYEHLNMNEISEELEAKLVRILLATLCDTSDKVVLLDLKVLCQIFFKKFSHEETKNYQKLLKPLIDLFQQKTDLLKDRGPLIIRQLCATIDARHLYITMSDILLEYDHTFIRSMVYILNTILLTAKQLAPIRDRLKGMNQPGNPDRHLFDCLYRTWCYSSVSAISLCLLTKCYRLASELILHFGNINITAETLREIDQLIQMLESPIFTTLRLDLLDANGNYYLRKSLYGLLMLLPQTEAFHLLQKRLQCIPADFSSSSSLADESKSNGQTANRSNQTAASGEQQTATTVVSWQKSLAYYVEKQKELEEESSSSTSATASGSSIHSDDL